MPTKWHTVQGNTYKSSILCRAANCWGLRSRIVWCFLFSDREYPRLGQMIVDYENPLKKMMEEFVPHGKVKSATKRENPITLFPISNGGHVLTRALCHFLPTSISVFDSRCKMHWSPCRWCTHAGICLQISGGTLSCSVWLVLPVPCSIQLSQTRSGFAVALNYFCKQSKKNNSHNILY